MRLLNTRTLELKQFNTGLVPVYAILSHTWEEEEVTLQELHTQRARQKKGFKKILDFCGKAAAVGYEWGWIDTCCIDKTDLVELSQAINSMFAWYRDSAVCFAYLSDFRQSGGWDRNALERCRWFTRGWTLQELIAPEHLIFYNAQWQAFGTKKEIADLISRITRISAKLLRAEKSLQEFSCAQKMSWAAYRQTTRVEDRAYSLLGIFNIYFPPTYGEGWRAFGRLQEEILKVSTDQSIFAWIQNGPLRPVETKDRGPYRISKHHTCSILAPTPDCFYDSSSVICAPNNQNDRTHPLLAPHISGVGSKATTVLNRPTAMANTGLQITFLVQRITVMGNRCLLEAMLNCYYERDQKLKPSIFLEADTNGFNTSLRSSLPDYSVPAWRVEPHYLGTATWPLCEEGLSRQYLREKIAGKRMMGYWVVIPFDIYPIHPTYPTWPESSNEVRRANLIWRQKDKAETAAAEKRILEAKQDESKKEAELKKDAKETLFIGIGLCTAISGAIYLMERLT